MAKGDDLCRSGVATGGKDRSFVCLCPAVGEEGFSQCTPRCDLGEFLRERYLRLVREHRRNMLQLIHLSMNLCVDLLIAMANAHRDNTAEEVQILVAVDIPYVLILR